MAHCFLYVSHTIYLKSLFKACRRFNMGYIILQCVPTFDSVHFYFFLCDISIGEVIECIIIAIYRFDFSLAIQLASFQIVVIYTHTERHTIHTYNRQFLFNEIWCAKWVCHWRRWRRRQRRKKNKQIQIFAYSACSHLSINLSLLIICVHICIFITQTSDNLVSSYLSYDNDTQQDTVFTTKR